MLKKYLLIDSLVDYMFESKSIVCLMLTKFDSTSMASTRDLCSYFSFCDDVSKDSRISISANISSTSNDVGQEEFDMVKEEVKKPVAKRNNYQNIPEKVRKKVRRYALVKGTKADIDKYSKI